MKLKFKASEGGQRKRERYKVTESFSTDKDKGFEMREKLLNISLTRTLLKCDFMHKEKLPMVNIFQ